MYTFYRDLHCSQKSLRDMLKLQRARDEKIVDKVPQFPMPTEEFNKYSDLVIGLSKQIHNLYMLFVDDESDCMVVHQGTCSFHESKMAAINSILRGS